MSKIILSPESEKLNKMTEKAHAMLVDAGIPVAPMEMISVRYDQNTRKKVTAECVEYNGRFIITLHIRAMDEKEVNGLQRQSFTSILHELVHTCMNPETGSYSLFDHNTTFVAHANTIREKYGFNIMSTIMPADFRNAHKACVHSIVCETCGAELDFFSTQTWEKFRKSAQAQQPFVCVYCGTKKEIIQTKEKATA